MLGIYIHIPFCKAKCGYCDFNSFPPEGEDVKAYKNALIKEINESPYKGEKCRTVFIGGGTPSFIPPVYIGEILTAVFSCFPPEKDCEVTMEANPDSLSPEGLRAYLSYGVNRLSMGVQSFNNEHLKLLGRIHSAERAEAAFYEAREAGFKNINIDLMFFYPGQSIESWVKDLEKAVILNPEHISAYSLIIEENTKFFNLYKNYQTNEDEYRIMYRKAKKILGDAGYERYEISNFAKEGFLCRHNAAYWKRTDYLGFGLSAHSLYGKRRFWNGDDFKAYLKGEKAVGEEVLTQRDEISEFMFLGLRMSNGVLNSEFQGLFGLSLNQMFGDVIKKYENMGLLRFDGERLRLTDEGIDVSDTIFADFV
ncbi:MAG: radical SAM family heme chaperone HemW [Clostridiales bacterium]|nr:radical SAM family heme chaperone HemW [Clostridiales bacterium]